MKISFMRFTDRYAGKLIITILNVFNTFAAILLRRTAKKTVPKDPKTLLIIKYFGFGSITNALPLIQVLRENYPTAQIVFMTFDSNRELFETAKVTDKLVTVRNHNFFVFFFDSIKAIFYFRKIEIDIAFDLEFFSKYSMVMSYMSGSSVRVGFFSYFNNRSSLLTHPTGFNHYKHISRTYLAMAESIGLSVPENDYKIILPRQDARLTEEIIKITGNNEGLPIIIINPNASRLCEMRKWPAENFVDLIGKLTELHPEYQYLLIGAKSESEYVNEIFNMCSNYNGRLKNIAGKTNLRQLLFLLEHSSLLISNDSGPVHLAAAYGTKTVALFGPETPVLYNPLNPNAKVLFKDCYCSPCINVLDNKSFEECIDVKCLKSISVEEVFQTAQSLLKR